MKMYGQCEFKQEVPHNIIMANGKHFAKDVIVTAKASSTT